MLRPTGCGLPVECLNDLVLALFKRSRKFATVPDGVTRYTLNREGAVLTCNWRCASRGRPERPTGPGLVRRGTGDVCLRVGSGRPEWGTSLASFRRDPAVEIASGPICSSSKLARGLSTNL